MKIGHSPLKSGILFDLALACSLKGHGNEKSELQAIFSRRKLTSGLSLAAHVVKHVEWLALFPDPQALESHW